MGTGAHTAEQTVQRGVLPYLPLHERVHYECDETAKGDDHIQLHVRGETAAVGGEPAEHRQEVKADYGKCRTYVGEAQLYEQVVQVGLSGLKGDLPRIMRALITRSVSNTGTQSTESVKGTR